METPIRPWLLALFLVAAFAILGIATAKEPVISPEQDYCEMYALWVKTKGDLGRPDYKGVAHKICPADE